MPIPCGRPLQHAPDQIDADVVCLMHSNDPGKAHGELYLAFLETFEAILAEAGEGRANLRAFVFPNLVLKKRNPIVLVRLPVCDIQASRLSGDEVPRGGELRPRNVHRRRRFFRRGL
jgi:hypothetical protein